MFYISVEPFTLKDPKASYRPATESHVVQLPSTREIAASQPTAQGCRAEMLTKDRSKQLQLGKNHHVIFNIHA